LTIVGFWDFGILGFWDFGMILGKKNKDFGKISVSLTKILEVII
jgi:hypothetical protein